LNHEINGLVPSASSAAEKEDAQFPRKLVYAITEIIGLLRDADTLPDTEISRAHRHIAFAWSAVLAGDIDDVRAEIALDDATRL
jgi:hypothetical protein